MLLDRSVHRVWSQIDFSGPLQCTVLNRDSGKQGRVGKRGEYPSLRRMHETGHIHHTRETIGKCNLQPESRKNFDPRYTPGRLWYDLRDYRSGRIFIGV